MSLRPYLIAWCLLFIANLGLRVAVFRHAGAALAPLYVIASLGLIVGVIVTYRNRLRHFLRREHPDLWRSLMQPGSRQVRDARVLKALLDPARKQQADIAQAKRTGAGIAVMTITWLISTLAIVLVLVLWRESCC